MADSLLVSVIIPTHQRRDALRRALVSLARQTFPDDSYEVIVSVDGSTDGTWEMLEDFAPPYALHAVEGPQRGRASALNVAVAIARGEVVVVLDDDMQVVPQFVERHYGNHPPGSRVCVLGPVPVHIHDGSSRVAAYVQAKFEAHLQRLTALDHVYTARDFYSGNASFRADVLRETEGFDEAFTAYGNEDIELSLQLRAKGVTLHYDPEAVAHQEYGKDLRGLTWDTLAKGGTTVLLARTHPDVFAELRLAAPHDSSRPWLAARAVLLRLTRRAPRAAAAVFMLAASLERFGLSRQPLFYRAVLDYAFWAGVDAELCRSSDEGELKRLADELQHGPIELLLRGYRGR